MRQLVAAFVVLVVSFVLSTPAVAALPPGGTFFDDDGDVHEGSIEAIAAAGVTVGCDVSGEFYCPDRVVTRGEMATLLVRALGLEPEMPHRFTDAEGVHQLSIGAVEAAGLFRGCNPPVDDHFCPDDPLTRGQAAAVLVRAFELPRSAGSSFLDVHGSVFEDAINRLAAAGVSKGCDPPVNEQFCPDRGLSRGEVATFVTRLMDLTPVTPRPPFVGRFVLGFWSDLVGPVDLATMNGKRLPRIILADTVGGPRISPDGKSVAYYDYRRECPADAVGPWECFQRIFTIPFRGGEEEQLTPNGPSASTPNWLHDGRSLGIVLVDEVGDDGEQYEWTLATVDVGEPRLVHELGTPRPDPLWSAEWSVNGDIAVTTQTDSGLEMVVVFDSSGRPRSLITGVTNVVFGPEWSPDGSQLAYISAGVDRHEVMISNPDGSEQKVIAAAHRISDLAWSPDGTRLAYYVDNLSPYGMSEVTVVDLTSGDVDVAAMAVAAHNIVWSPDSATIAYLEGSRVWAVAADGGDPWPLTPGSLEVFDFDWGPTPQEAGISSRRPSELVTLQSVGGRESDR